MTYTSTQRLALRALAGLLWLAVHAVILWLLLTLAGCNNRPALATRVADAQHPGTSTGAGATFQGPANSAAPSTQIAQRRAAYYPAPTREWPLPTTGLSPSPSSPPSSVSSVSSPSSPSSPSSAPPQPAWIDEKTETTFGQHQDAAALVQAATALGSWGKARWAGIFLMLASAFGLAWAHNNPEGYPLVCWKGAAIGLGLALLDPSPWWLLLLLIPAGFYFAQKLNLLRLP